MPSKRHHRLVVASLLIIFSAAVSVINGFSIITARARQDEKASTFMMMSSSTNIIEGYEYIHPDIAQMLNGDRQQLSSNDDPIKFFPFVVDPGTLTLQLKQQTDPLGDESIMPMNQLQNFANYCDDIVFERRINTTLNVPDKILGLISLSQLSSVSRDSAIVIASMVSVNLLESSIRSVLQRVRPQNKHQSKGAPLLSNMIEELSKLDVDPLMEYNTRFPLAHLSPILKALLLPTKVGGINLRNLLSHGFLSTLDRRWLSLTLVLIQTLDSCCDSAADDDKNEKKKQRDISDISSLAKYDLMKREIDFGKAVLSSNSRMQQLESPSCGGAFVPSSHQNLLRFTLHKSQEQPEDVSEQQQYQKTSIGILESACIIHSQPPPTLDPITSSRNMYWIFFCCHSMVP